MPLASSSDSGSHAVASPGTANQILDSRFIACVACLRPVGRGRCLDLRTAKGIVLASRTSALVYHVPSLPEDLDEFDWSFTDLLNEMGNREKFVLVANTSRAGSAAEAVKQAFASREIFRRFPHADRQLDPVVKLEVLRSDLTSIDREVVRATEELVSAGFEVVPLVSPDVDILTECARAGVKFARVLSGRIGKGTGIQNVERVQQVIASSPLPLFCEGGITTVEHVREAMEIGADGVLINSAFHMSKYPVELCRSIRNTIDSFHDGGV